eukprot:comp23282_c0_seq1/m.38135 comp23282_c0_seq1/g.38135  ORF comp23282_c0_seq1/g.38135 comp23282_c0_seq1/m.38135 type:complete len:481 (-) comp23282_c0_seq1:713-2155(-)
MRVKGRFCLVLLSGLLGSSCGSTIDELLTQARGSLREGNYEAALEKFSQVIDKDGNSFAAYDQRATVYQAVGRTKNALADLEKAVQLNPKLLKAWIKRATLEIKLGRFADAEESLEHVKDDPEGQQLMESLRAARDHKAEGKRLYEAGRWEEAVHMLTVAVEHAKEDDEIREIRAEANLALGNMAEAIGDYTRATRLTNDNTNGFLKLSQLYYQSGEAQNSLAQIRECLKLDPDHKDCFAHYKRVKKLAQTMNGLESAESEERWEDAVGKIENALKQTGDSRTFQAQLTKKLCSVHLKLKRGDEGVTACTTAAEHNLGDADVLCDRAEAHILLGKFDEAINDFQQALQHHEGYQRAQEGLGRAQKLQKQAKKRDYYAILGVPRDATKKQVTKAYRKLALEWHPDKYEGHDREMAEKKFMDLSDAKEVLLDEEKRRQFDQGIDPLDPEAQQEHQRQQHGHPFMHPHHFHQGGQHFHFRWGG